MPSQAPLDFALSPPTPRQATPVEREIRRLGKAAERVLAYLQAHRSATNVELSVPEIGGLAAIRRVWELQQAGHDIRKSHVKGGIWRYELIG